MPDTVVGDQLHDRVILITGAARGIGASVAKACALQGATVILLDKQLNLLESVYDEIEKTTSTLPAIYPIDFKGASLTDYEQLAESILSNYGRLDGLIHCAATLGQIAPTQHQDVKTWLETLHVNLTSSFLLTQVCLPLLRQSENSHIIFTTDERKTKAYSGAYGIAKAGIEAFSSQLADELETEDKVRVELISPAPTHTELFVQAFPAIDPSQLQKPEQVAQEYLALLCSGKNLPPQNKYSVK